MPRSNVLTAGKKVQADQAARAGDRLAAQALFARVCQLDPMDVEAWAKRSLLEKGLGNYPQAERFARHALTLAPHLGYGHFALGQALHCQGLRSEAIHSYQEAIRHMPDLVDAHYLLGLALHEQGDTAQAIVRLEQTLRLRPAHPQALTLLGAAHVDRGSLDTGLHCLQKAVALQPHNAVALGNISLVLRLRGDNQAAIDNFRHALRLAPDNVDLMASFAGLLEKQGEAEEAQRLVEVILQHVPDHAMGNLVAAQLDRRAQRLQQAADRLHRLLGQTLVVGVSADITLELGQLLDQMGDSARAYPLVVEGKRKKALATQGADGAGGARYLSQLKRIRQLATPELAAQMRVQTERCAMPTTDALAPVFLVGFPRSGTTLLEQILDSHPAIQTLEEKPTVALMVGRTLDMLDERHCTLADLDASQLAQLRQLYLAEAGRHVQLQPGILLVDKMPLNTVNVPVIARVFPNARFILALRHPCDVALSCLMQNFFVNASMAHFFTLEDTAHLYDQVMAAWLHYAQVLPLKVHTLRYEDLIEDVPATSRRLLDFLGLPWDEAVLSHTEHARQRGAINTPSYHQVVQPIYQRSKFRWTRYASQLSPVMPVLQPYIEKFGYA